MRASNCKNKKKNNFFDLQFPEKIFLNVRTVCLKTMENSILI